MSDLIELWPGERLAVGDEYPCEKWEGGSKSGHICNRPVGHLGRHVGFVSRDQAVAAWGFVVFDFDQAIDELYRIAAS